MDKKDKKQNILTEVQRARAMGITLEELKEKEKADQKARKAAAFVGDGVRKTPARFTEEFYENQ